MTRDQLRATHCIPRKGAEHALAATEIARLLTELPDWQLAADGREIRREFRFADFHRTIGFVNAVAWIANAEDHHPDLEAGYARCLLRFSTHDVGGLSLNDFILAARVDALLG